MKSIDVLLQGYGLADIAVLVAKPDDKLAELLSKANFHGPMDGRFSFVEDIVRPHDDHSIL